MEHANPLPRSVRSRMSLLLLSNIHWSSNNPRCMSYLRYHKPDRPRTDQAVLVAKAPRLKLDGEEQCNTLSWRPVRYRLKSESRLIVADSRCGLPVCGRSMALFNVTHGA
jgi:hypothetical protein